ncbi:hypothetical protein ACOSQ3_010369 [Xanthoceras sorbifolium]
MSVSIEALAMAGADCQECNIDIEDWQRESIEHLLTETYKEDTCNICFNCSKISSANEDGITNRASFSFYWKAAGQNVPNKLLKRGFRWMKRSMLRVITMFFQVFKGGQ